MTREMTPEQSTAIVSVAGDIAISAGAGSGKTTVLAHRFAHAMKQDVASGWAPAQIDEILTITFTNKAAGEIAERVRRVINREISVDAGRRVGEAWISTIHTFCARLIRRHLLEAGVEPGFAQIDDVTASVLQGEAFEAAARDLYGRDPGVTELLHTTSLDTVRSQVVSIHDNVRAMGLSPADTRVPNGLGDLAALKLAVEQAADVLLGALEGCQQTESIVRKRASLGVWCGRLGACSLGDTDACATLIGLEESYDITRLSGEAQAANRALKAALESLGSAARAAEKSALLEGYRALVVAFAAHYAALKAQRAALDFDDLQEIAVALLTEHPKLAERYRRHFRLLMIDEFQDTNELQLRVLEPLRNADLCVVGDERQSIYGFRYADVEVFERVRGEISSEVRLAKNFRSHADVLEFVNHAFSGTHLFGPGFMRLEAGRSDDWRVPVEAGAPRVECVLLDAAEGVKSELVGQEARLVAGRIRQLIDDGTSGSDIAILLRNATSASAFAAALEAQRVPVLVSAGVELFCAPEVQELTALLRAIAVPADDEALATVLASRLVGISDDALLALRRGSPRQPLWSAVRAIGQREDERTELAPDDETAVTRAYRVIDDLAARQGALSLHDMVHEACDALDFDLTLLSQGASGLRAWGNVLKIARYAEQFDETSSSDPAAFVEYLEQRKEGSRDKTAVAEAGGDVVRIMTIHSAKGLEFPVVFVADLGTAKSRAADSVLLTTGECDGRAVPEVGMRLPGDGGAATALHQRLARASREGEVEEQKRCLYVACTRAEELLILSGSSKLQAPASEGTMMIDWIRESLGDPQESTVFASGAAGAAVTIAQLVEDEAVEPTGRATVGAPLFESSSVSVDAPREETTYPARVSYSSLHLHEQCPLSYRLASHLGLGVYRDPGGQRASEFGSAFHVLMQLDGASEPSVDALAAVQTRFGLGAEERDRLKAAVATFQASPVAAQLAEADRVEREVPLRVSLDRSVLEGSIDVLAWTGDRALVVDYKTGDAPALPEPQQRLAGYELQAGCYALAALLAGASAVEAVFCFVEHEAREVRFAFAPSDAAAIRADLEARIERIALDEATHLPAYHSEVCRWCPGLGGVCPIDPPRGSGV